MFEEPKVFVTITRKINLGNYESVEVSAGLSQIPASAGEGLIDEMLGVVRTTFDKLNAELMDKARAARRIHGIDQTTGGIELAELQKPIPVPEKPSNPRKVKALGIDEKEGERAPA